MGQALNKSPNVFLIETCLTRSEQEENLRGFNRKFRSVI